jgi:ribosomal protein S12 methylthiotransferase
MNFPAKEEMKISGERVLTTKSYLAYLKIAEGCNNRCTYCAISLIRGDYRSRPVEEILAEAKELAALGVKELNIVAQDTTLYGIDIYGKIELPRLLKDLCKIDGIEWIRLLYSYPDKITDELIDVIASEPKIVKYMDIPLQHVDGTVLKRMNRPGDMNTIEDLLNKLRSRVPGIVIRTTFIVGFPGETEEQFNNLCKFVSKQKFERLGCFTYSPEEDTPAAEYPDQIDQAVKNRRQELIMDCQLRIINEFNDSKVGEKLRVLVEGYDKEYEVYYGRSYMDAPEVDCNIFFKVDNGQEIKEGDFVEVIVEGADGYDLVGKLIEGKEISKEGER